MAITLERPDRFRNRMEILADRLNLRETGDSDGERLGRFRNYLAESEKLIHRYHRGGGSGLRVVNCRAISIDVIVSILFEAAQEKVKEETGSPYITVAILALGGYGRSELCPLSDIDLMFLYPNKERNPNFRNIQQIINDTILYPLWDLNLKVGHSTRSAKEAVVEANADVQSKNAMMEARFLAGNEPLYDKFYKSYARFIKRDDTHLYLKERLEDQNQRRERFANTVFLQEPDIKNGVGGLRDYQNILWMVRLKYNSLTIADLIKKGLLRAKEHDDLIAAYDFLLRTRNELHFQSKRPTDLLNLEKQPKVAWGLKYRTRDIFKRVETFMRDYYTAAQVIFRLSTYLETRLAIDSDTSISFAAVIESRRHFKSESFDGFTAINGVLTADSTRVFKKDPIRLIRVFRHLQSRELTLDFDLERTIGENLELINESLIHSPEANRAFRSILQSKGNVYPVLVLMNRTGVLPKFIPEWGDLQCLVQHEYYHRYTADEHTLNTIRELDSIFTHSEQELTVPYRKALEDTEFPALLYIILLLHDIGKGKGIKNHCEEGASIARVVIDRLGIIGSVRENIIFLIRNHLEMARIWQRLDIDDPQTVSSFAAKIGDSDRLRYLYALTYCDARGTSIDLWNGFKNTLHNQLYTSTMKSLSTTSMRSPIPPTMSQDHIRSQLPEIAKEEIEAHFNLLPDRYFSYHSEEEVILHIRMIHSLLENIASADSIGSLVPIVEWHNDQNLGLTTVHIVTWDRAGLFYKLAGAFSLAGLSIVSSKALSRADHITIDTFYVSKPSGGVVENEESLNTFKKHLNDSLLHNADLMTPIEEKELASKKPSYLQTDTELPGSLPPKVEIYHELSLKRTIIEIEAEDKLGLLYRMTHAIFEQGFDITFARISTERKVAVDTFYIEPIQPGTSADSSALIELKENLLKIVESEADKEI